MKMLNGLYLEEVEFVLENMQRNSQITIKKETGNQATYSVIIEDENLHKKMEEMLFYAQRDYSSDYYDNSKFNSYPDDDDED